MRKRLLLILGSSSDRIIQNSKVNELKLTDKDIPRVVQKNEKRRKAFNNDGCPFVRRLERQRAYFLVIGGGAGNAGNECDIGSQS